MHINYVEEEGKTVVYPRVEQDSNFNQLNNPSVVITENMRTVTMLHRQKREGEIAQWDMVQFSAMGMGELQRYVDTLQNIVNRMHGRKIVIEDYPVEAKLGEYKIADLSDNKGVALNTELLKLQGNKVRVTIEVID